MKKKKTSSTWDWNKKQKRISKKIDHICIAVCLIATLAVALFEYKDRKTSDTDARLHGGRTVL